MNFLQITITRGYNGPPRLPTTKPSPTTIMLTRQLLQNNTRFLLHHCSDYNYTSSSKLHLTPSISKNVGEYILKTPAKENKLIKTTPNLTPSQAHDHQIQKKKERRISDYQKKKAIGHLVSQAELISLAPRAG